MLSLRAYTWIWIILACTLAYESYQLNFDPQNSIFAFLKAETVLFEENFKIDPSPGKDISLYYGWIGFSIMCLTNLYILRKRLHLMSNWGKISNWLNFHIFCGLVGPTFILFHTNFKIGGLVAVSFWSMVVSFSSGIVGRYFYMQLVKKESDLMHEADLIEMNLNQVLKDSKYKITPERLVEIKADVMRLAGVRAFDVHTSLPILRSLWHSITGDLLLRTRLVTTVGKFPPTHILKLKQFALLKRRIVYWEEFRRIMGYWHSFHSPFAFFMYLVAVIHIATALLYRV